MNEQWSYCPECGSTDYERPHSKLGNFCFNCGQEWHVDIDYSEIVRKRLRLTAVSQHARSALGRAALTHTDQPAPVVSAQPDERTKELIEQYQTGYRHGLADGQAEIREPDATSAQPAAALRATERIGAMHKGVVGVFAAIKAEAQAASAQPVAAASPDYWMSIQHGELKVSYEDESDPAYKWFPVWAQPVAAAPIYQFSSLGDKNWSDCTKNFYDDCPKYNYHRRIVYAAPAAPVAQAVAPALTVWEGPMRESNGRQNYTAVLHRKDSEGFDVFTDGFQFARSEYPDRTRYEADFMRWLIGERATKPELWDDCYDMDKHSGYVAPAAPVAQENKP